MFQANHDTLLQKCESFRLSIRKKHHQELFRERRVRIIAEIYQREPRKESGEDIPEDSVTVEFITGLLRPPISAETLLQLVRIIKASTTLNLKAEADLHRSLLTIALEHFSSPLGATLALLLLRYSVNQDMDSHIVQRTIKEIDASSPNNTDQLSIYLAILEELTNKSQDFENCRKVLQSIPVILEKVGYAVNFIFIVVNLSSNGMLASPEIVISCIRAGIASKQQHIIEETYHLVSHFVSMASPAALHPYLSELITWNWQTVNSNTQPYKGHCLNRLTQLIRTFGQEAASIMVETGILRNINCNIMIDKVRYRLFYFRIVKELVKHCKQDHLISIELIANGIIDILFDHGLGSTDMNIVTEALQIFQTLLRRNGPMNANKLASKLARDNVFLDTLENLTYSNRQDICKLAIEIKEEYFEYEMDLE